MRREFERLLLAPEYAGLGDAYLDRLLLPLAESLRARLACSSDCLVVAISGWPGSGKSTLARLLVNGFLRLQIRALQFSLDDLYFNQAKRRKLAEEVHPLFRFRGVPGTHDVVAGIDLIDRLRTAGDHVVNRIPRFDKLADEPCSEALLPRFRGRPQLLIIDGWFWNTQAVSEEELQTPINELEARKDPNCSFRLAVNRELRGDYPKLFAQAQLWVKLQLLDWQSSVRFRIKQEEKALASLKPPRVLDATARARLKEFVQLMERVATRHPTSREADWIVELNEVHQVDKVDFCGERRCLQGSRF